MKRYVAERGSDLVRSSMQEAEGWFMCRVGLVETLRAVGLVAGPTVMDSVRDEWEAMGVLEVDQGLAVHAAELALEHGLRSLDALHLAAALLLPREELVVATWDRRLHEACVVAGLRVLPDLLPA